jgi:hypothetical protein
LPRVFSESQSGRSFEKGAGPFSFVLDELKEVCLKFIVPGSKTVFQPDVYATIIAYTPFFTSPAQQVLVQGWQVTPQNLPQLLTILEKQLQELEDRVAEVSGIAQAQLDALRVFLQHSNFNIHDISSFRRIRRDWSVVSSRRACSR